MSLSWADAFPLQDESIQAAKLLVQSWKELVRLPGSDIDAKLAEPKLTFRLCEYLKAISDSRGKLTGRWGQENWFSQVDLATGKSFKPQRTDIEYFSNRNTPVLRLIFEFKKLDGKQSAITHYCGLQGLRRFIDGDYAAKEPLAFMAGIVTGDKAGCVSKLNKTLMDTASAVNFQWKVGKPSTVQPSLVLPSLSAFDTEHLRPAEKLPSQGFVRVCHILLDF
jgi:hypothetical protein